MSENRSCEFARLGSRSGREPRRHADDTRVTNDDNRTAFDRGPIECETRRSESHSRRTVVRSGSLPGECLRNRRSRFVISRRSLDSHCFYNTLRTNLAKVCLARDRADFNDFQEMSSSGQKPVAMAAKSPDKLQTDPPVLKTTSASGTEPKLAKVKSLDESIRGMVVESKTLFSQSASPATKTVPAAVEVVAATEVASIEAKSSKKIPVKKSPEQKTKREDPVHVAVPRQRAPLPEPTLKARPIVLATHLVPSFPIHLFELIAEAIEVATQLPVCLLHESRTERPVAKEVADVAILPVYGEWEDGELLPVTFVFNHRLNELKETGVYVDVVIGTDHAANVEDILDLRGRRCALPDRKQSRGSAALLLRHLRTRGEGPAFFGNTLDSGSHLATLQMVAGRQAEVGVLDAPVIKCHQRALAGFDTLHILASLGPLPPYPIYVKKSLSSDIKNKICSYLKNLNNDREWKERFAEYGIHGFASNSKDAYILQDLKEIATSAPYY